MTGPLPPLRRVLGALALGVLVGVVGSAVHRVSWPVSWPSGLVGALALVVSAGVLARSLTGGAGLLGAGAAMLAVNVLLAQEGPGGDVLMPAGDERGVLWLAGSVLLLVPVAFLPRSWFDDTPRPPHDAATAPDAPPGLPSGPGDPA